MRFPSALLVGLASCAPIPGVPRAPADLLAPPDLVPVEGLLAAGDALAALSSPAPELSVEAEALARRAGGLPAPAGADPGAGPGVGLGPGAPDPDRVAALAARAEALRAPVLADEERARLGREALGSPSLQ